MIAIIAKAFQVPPDEQKRNETKRNETKQNQCPNVYGTQQNHKTHQDKSRSFSMLSSSIIQDMVFFV